MSEYDVIVLDLDGDRQMLAQCLASIAAQSVLPRRTIVVDNGSRTPTLERIGAAENVEVFRLERNRGFAGGMNVGLAQSAAPAVALVNNDVVLERDWAASLLERLADEGCGAVQSILMNGDGTRVDGAGIALEGGRVTQLGHGLELAAVPLAHFRGVSATAALYRREALMQAAGEGSIFDERFFAYFEDVELAGRLDEKGWKQTLVPLPLARHRGSATAGALGEWATFLRTRNRYFVARLHRLLRIRALLTEDLRRLAGHASRAELQKAMAIARGVVAGLTRRL